MTPAEPRTAQTRQNAERAVIAGREADMALHVVGGSGFGFGFRV